MVITEVSADDVLKFSREALGLRASSKAVDDTFLAAVVRRTAGILCPCSPATLTTAVLESLRYLIEASGDMTERVALVVEALIVGGDLLELNQAMIDDGDIKSTCAFAAPPSFVETSGGNVFLIGITPDEATPLPASLSERVAYEGFVRILSPQASENLPSILRDLGLVELSTRAWLKAPKPESATDLRDGMLRRLLEQTHSGAIPAISILDPGRNVSYYVGRWIEPTKESGNYVARRPQAYGAPLWGFASLMHGGVTKFLDFPLKGTRWRGCDVAWHLQMAIDHGRGTPQFYRRRPAPDGACLDFFSPLPLWAQRRLALLGRPVPRNKCLFSYWIAQRELGSEEAFLQERLWLSPCDETEQEVGE